MNKRPKAKLTALIMAASLLALTNAARAELSVTQGSAYAATDARSAAVPEWIYTLRPGDTFPAVARELLASGYSATRLLQYNGLQSGNMVQEGDSIRLPLNWLKRQPEPARTVSVSGSVQLISGIDGRKQPLREDSLVRVGDEILSGSGSATVELADGSEIRISPNSRLIFNRLTQYGKSGMVDTRLRLDQGEVHTRVKPVIEGGARFEIETPSAVAAVRGTAFALQTSGRGTNLQVTKGVVDFGAPGKTRRIPAGYSASVSTSSGAGLAIHRLPPAPAIEPITTPITRFPAELRWKQSPSPEYRLDIFETESGRWVESRKLRGNTFDISLLDNGDYELQLAGLDSRGIAGMPAVMPLEVALQARAATLVLPEDGATANDDMPEFRWSMNGSNEVARVEIAEDMDFRSPITTSEWAPENSALPAKPLGPGQYYWRVVTEAGGNSVASTAPRKLVVNGSLPPVRIISVNYVDSQVRVFWSKVDTASEYRLQLSEEPSFQSIIKEATLPDTTAALRLIPGRRYFVRLKALSEGPLTSRWGPGRELYLE